MIHLKCLSVRQPWAELITLGEKKVENRSWRTNYTGLLGIHASLNRGDLKNCTDSERDACGTRGRTGKFDFGCLFSVAEVVGCYRYQDLPSDLRGHEYAIDDPDNWCWVLRNPVRLQEPFPAQGKVGFFILDVPTEHFPNGLLKKLDQSTTKKTKD